MVTLVKPSQLDPLYIYGYSRVYMVSEKTLVYPCVQGFLPGN